MNSSSSATEHTSADALTETQHSAGLVELSAAVEDFVHAYRTRYLPKTGNYRGVRANAPMRAEVAALNSVWARVQASNPDAPGASDSSCQSETGWLIEGEMPDGSPGWVTLKPTEALWGVVLTKESADAIRFARRADAEAYYACHIDDGPFRITEHRWG